MASEEELLLAVRPLVESAVAQAKAALGGALSGGKSAGLVRAAKFIAELEDLLARFPVSAFSEASTASAAAAPPPASLQLVTPTGRDAITDYGLERVGSGLVLAEYRTATAPFRCERAVYEALARTFDAAGRPLSFEDAHRMLDERVGRPVPDYAVRVVFRFWQRLREPLLARDRGKYRALHSGSLHERAADAWVRLPIRER